MKSRLLLALLVLGVGAGPALALRCGTSLVVEGQTKYDVLQRCGEPAYADSHVEYRPIAAAPYASGQVDAYGNVYPPPMRGVQVDEWVYNFGSTQLMPMLRFEDGRLATIGTGGYGH